LEEFNLFPQGTPYSFKRGAAGILIPGWHDLKIELLSGNRTIDSMPLQFVIGPAKPEGLRYLRVPEGLKLIWYPNPEETLVPLRYSISADGVQLDSTARKEFIHPNGSEQIRYTVIAHHDATDLSSPASEPAKKAEGILLHRSATPIISGDITAFTTLTNTSARIVGTDEKLDLGSTLLVNWLEPPLLLSSVDSCELPVVARILGYPAGGTTYTLSAQVQAVYTDGSTRSGAYAYGLYNDGFRSVYSDSRSVSGTNTFGSGVLQYIDMEVSKDLFFNFGEAHVRWEYTPQ
jgi:hypothetical protein